MGVVDAWEQLSALERRTSKKIDLEQQLPIEPSGSETEVAQLEPTTTLPSEPNENFQVPDPHLSNFNITPTSCLLPWSAHHCAPNRPAGLTTAASCYIRGLQCPS